MATVQGNKGKEDYNVWDISRNQLTRWRDLEYHLQKYTEQKDELDRQENPIPEKYDPEGDAMEQAERILDGYEEELEKERQNRVDLTDGSVGIANDPDDAKDHDDAYTVFKHEDGYTAQVHIADVTHFITPGSPIDEEIQDRGVTFYLGENTRHMTPEKLAQEVFSLAPGKDRLALTIEMEFDENGNRKDAEVYESVVSTEHITHTHADRILDSTEEIEDFYEENLVNEDAREFRDMARNLSDAQSLANELRDNRWDESLLLNPRDSQSSKIVEELMIEANSAAGDYMLEEMGLGLFRVEEEPDEPLGETAAEVLTDFDYNLTDLDGDIHRDTAKTINNFFQKTEDSKPGIDTIKDDEEHEREVRTQIVRNLERAKFTAAVTDQNFHDGLDKFDYAQITSPIRRATDFWNHRILKSGNWMSDFWESETVKDHEWKFSQLKDVAETTTQQYILADEGSRVWKPAHT